MAKRFTDNQIWREDWYLDLSIEYKLFTKYLYDVCDHAGIWKISTRTCKNECGIDLDVSDFLKSANEGKERFSILSNGRLFIPGFILFQYGTGGKFTLNLNNKVHLSVYNLLIENGIDVTSLPGFQEVLNLENKPLANPIQTPSKVHASPLQGAKDKDIDIEREKEINEEFEIFCENLEKIVQSVDPTLSLNARKFHNEVSKKLRQGGYSVDYEHKVDEGVIDLFITLKNQSVGIELDNRTPRGKSLIKLKNMGCKSIIILRDPFLTDGYYRGVNSDKLILYKHHPGVPEEIIYPFNSKLFFNAWQSWINYKKTEFNFKYKSLNTEQIALKELFELSKGSEETAISIINQSIASSWKGFFPLKALRHGSNEIKQPESKTQALLNQTEEQLRKNHLKYADQ